jgi:hypothetical protein
VRRWFKVAPASQESINEREDIEVESLIEAVFPYYGFDFRDSARASLKPR